MHGMRTTLPRIYILCKIQSSSSQTLYKVGCVCVCMHMIVSGHVYGVFAKKINKAMRIITVHILRDFNVQF